MKFRFRHITEWKDRIIIDGLMSIAEASIVLFISSMYLFFLTLSYGLTTNEVGVVDALKFTVASTLHPTETIIYVTGILASTTAYFVVRLKECARYIKRIVSVFGLTVVLCFLAMPLFTSGLQGSVANELFAARVAGVVGVGALIVWLFSLFSQRRIFERPVRVDGDRKGIEIARLMEKQQ